MSSFRRKDHCFASAAAEMEFSEPTIAGLLGRYVKGVTAC